jgi:hypothetical protein
MQMTDCYLNTFREMLADPKWKLRLLQSKYSHVAIGLHRSGIHHNVYQIGVLTFKAAFTIDKVLFS